MSTAVARPSPAANLPDEYGRFQIEWPTGDELSHILSLDVLHGNEVHAVHFIEIKDCADVWVIERGGASRRPVEAFEGGLFEVSSGGSTLITTLRPNLASVAL